MSWYKVSAEETEKSLIPVCRVVVWRLHKKVTSKPSLERWVRVWHTRKKGHSVWKITNSLVTAEKVDGYRQYHKEVSKSPTELNQRLLNKGVVTIRFILETETCQRWWGESEKEQDWSLEVWTGSPKTVTKSWGQKRWQKEQRLGRNGGRRSDFMCNKQRRIR